MIGKLEYFWNKKRYHKKENAILLYFEKPFNQHIFEMTYLLGHMHLNKMCYAQGIAGLVTNILWTDVLEPKKLQAN